MQNVALACDEIKCFCISLEHNCSDFMADFIEIFVWENVDKKLNVYGREAGLLLIGLQVLTAFR